MPRKKLRSAFGVTPASAPKVMPGQRFASVVVVGWPFYARLSESTSQQYAICRCDCGRYFAERTVTLRAGKRVSCGCLADQYRRIRSTTHGSSYTRLYSIWCGMKNRCQPGARPANAHYNGRGIRVSSDWEKHFGAFKDWALANGYFEGLELDRIDGQQGYSPENCRWASRSAQMWNQGIRRTLKTSRYKGVSWSLSRKKWQAQIQKHHKHLHLGFFSEEAEAARAYDRAANDLFGPYARPNFRD